MTNTSMEIILEILFLSFSNADLKFDAKKLIWRLYTTTEVLPTSKSVELIKKYEFL